jgi:hypothetical protein
MVKGRDVGGNDGRCLGTSGERRPERLLTRTASGGAPGPWLAAADMAASLRQATGHFAGRVTTAGGVVLRA